MDDNFAGTYSCPARRFVEICFPADARVRRRRRRRRERRGRDSPTSHRPKHTSPPLKTLNFGKLWLICSDSYTLTMNIHEAILTVLIVLVLVNSAVILFCSIITTFMIILTFRQTKKNEELLAGLFELYEELCRMLDRIKTSVELAVWRG